MNVNKVVLNLEVINLENNDHKCQLQFQIYLS
jgi:hypothetical protein